MAYIVVEGVIGVGKTALTRLLGDRMGMPTLFEQFEENPFLRNFYGDRARYAFQTEVFFLLNRYRQQQSVVKPMLERGDLVADYLFAKTKLFAGLNLQGDEWDLFCEIYDALSRQTAQPGVIVYLKASVDTLMARIYQRDRSFERNMDRGYIATLAEEYASFFAEYKGPSTLLEIETDGLDLVRDEGAQREMIGLIELALAEADKAGT
jgi:deoxyadenosine/deoxycytidine kinase